MTIKELNRSAVEQTIDYHLNDPNPRIRISDISKSFDKIEYECHIFNSPIIHLNDGIQLTTKVYIKNLKRNKKGIFNISLKDIELYTKINIKNYFYFLKSEEPQFNVTVSLHEYKNLKNYNKFVKYIYNLIKEYNQFDQGIRDTFTDLTIDFVENFWQSKQKLFDLMVNYNDSIIDYDYHDPDFIRKLTDHTGLYDKQVVQLIDLMKSLYYNK